MTLSWNKLTENKFPHQYFRFYHETKLIFTWCWHWVLKDYCYFWIVPYYFSSLWDLLADERFNKPIINLAVINTCQTAVNVLFITAAIVQQRISLQENTVGRHFIMCRLPWISFTFPFILISLITHVVTYYIIRKPWIPVRSPITGHLIAKKIKHYSDVIMSAMASQITGVHCLLNRLFRRRSKRTSKFSVTGLCAGNSPMTGEFLAQRASNAENVSIWWRHHIFNHHHDTIFHWSWAIQQP